MSRLLITLFIATALTVFATAPSVTTAQLPTVGNSTNLSIVSSPENPRAFQNVVISISNYSTDLDRATIVWTLNGKEVKRGIGEKRITIQTGALGSTSAITVTAITEEGGRITDSLYVVPSNVDLIWEANTYVPPFYEGKALYPIQGSVTVSAIPHLVNSKKVKLRAKDLHYQWLQDRKPLQEYSGFGKDSLTIIGPVILKPTLVEVIVSSRDNVLIAQTSITLNPTDPVVVLYEEHPARGILYEKAIGGTYETTSQDTKIVAVPYFFSLAKPSDGTVTYTWILNNRTVGKQTDNFLSLVSSGRDSGTASVAVEAQHGSRVFQIGSQSMSIRFGSNQTNTAF